MVRRILEQYSRLLPADGAFYRCRKKKENSGPPSDSNCPSLSPGMLGICQPVSVKVSKKVVLTFPARETDSTGTNVLSLWWPTVI